MLHYMRSLLPGYPDNPLFEAIFLDLLPANARDAAVRHEVLEDMAEAVDKVLAEAPASSSVVAQMSVQHEGDTLAQVSRNSPVQAAPRKPRDMTLCFVHSRYGRSAYKCTSPKTCRMKVITIPKPDAQPASGNANAGRC